MQNFPLEHLGPVVGYFDQSGRACVSAWAGETIRVWAVGLDFRLLPPLAHMRARIVEAFIIEGPRPEGVVEVICLKKGKNDV